MDTQLTIAQAKIDRALEHLIAARKLVFAALYKADLSESSNGAATRVQVFALLESIRAACALGFIDLANPQWSSTAPKAASAAELAAKAK